MTKIKSIDNFRDIGGAANSAGRTVKKGLIYRSGNLAGLTEADGALLRDEYGIKRIIDLRTKQETIESPDIIPDGIEYLHMPVFDERTLGITHETKTNPETAAKSGKTGEEIRGTIPDIAGIYPRMINEDGRRENIAAVVAKILESTSKGEGVLYHCTAGKDRTGAVTAVLYKMLGVPEDTIVKEYLLTNRVAKPLARKYSTLALVFKHDRALAKSISDAFLAKKEYIRAFLDALNRKYETGRELMEKGMNIPPDTDMDYFFE